MSGIRTPLNTTPAIALGNKKWVKEILRTGPLHYNGNVFDVTPDYLDTVVQAYQDGALKRVPFQLAGKSNEHDESPERRRGFIEGVFREGDKLKSIIDLEDEANHLVETDKSFPVSVLIKHDRTKGNTGQHWDAVLTHVLGTYDPVLDLDDWEPYLAASNDDADVIDFLALSAAPADAPEFSDAEIDAALAMFDDPTDSPSSDEGATTPDSEEAPVATLADLLSNASEDELKALRVKLDSLSPADVAVTEDDDISDAEIDEALALVEEFEAGDEDDAASTEGDADDEAESEEAEPEAIAASHEADTQLALANAQMAEQINAQGLELSQMRARVNESDWADRKTFYAQASVPGYLVDKAKPFLHGNDTSLKLSQTDKAQAAKLVDSLLLEFGGTLQRLGLAQGVVGTVEDTTAEQAENETRKSAVASALNAAGVRPARS